MTSLTRGRMHLSDDSETKECGALVGVDLFPRSVWHAIQHGPGGADHVGFVCCTGNYNVRLGDRGASSDCDDLGSGGGGSGESLVVWQTANQE
jgi:hypothetical protein